LFGFRRSSNRQGTTLLREPTSVGPLRDGDPSSASKLLYDLRDAENSAPRPLATPLTFGSNPDNELLGLQVTQ
jgi:hypothetical protein